MENLNKTQTVEQIAEQQQYTAFAQELAKLSQKYGVVIQSIGGIMTTDPKNTRLESLSYTDDLNSGDIQPLQWFED